MPALEKLLGGTAGLSPATMTWLTKQWSDDHADLRTWDLADRDYVSVWADGVHPVPLVRAGAHFENGVLVERPEVAA